MQNIILNIILFISSVLSVNTVISVPLLSVINTDTQQVEYIGNNAKPPSLILQKTSEVQFWESLSSLNINRRYLYADWFNNAFDLHQYSLILVGTLISRQKYIIQKQTFQNTVVAFHQQFIKTLFLVESENLNA